MNDVATSAEEISESEEDEGNDSHSPVSAGSFASPPSISTPVPSSGLYRKTVEGIFSITQNQSRPSSTMMSFGGFSLLVVVSCTSLVFPQIWTILASLCCLLLLSVPITHGYGR